LPVLWLAAIKDGAPTAAAAMGGAIERLLAGATFAALPANRNVVVCEQLGNCHCKQLSALSASGSPILAQMEATRMLERARAQILPA